MVARDTLSLFHGIPKRELKVISPAVGFSTDLFKNPEKGVERSVPGVHHGPQILRIPKRELKVRRGRTRARLPGTESRKGS